MPVVDDLLMSPTLAPKAPSAALVPVVAPTTVVAAPASAPAPAPASAPAPVPAIPPEDSYPTPEKMFEKNKAYIKEGDHTYNTKLTPKEELTFREWVKRNKIPFNVDADVTDYDMRGFWKAYSSGDPKAVSQINPNDKELHYSDYWKTPYHETFSAESQWADPEKAPTWNDKDQLVTPDGTVLYDERAEAKKRHDRIANGS